MNLDTTDTINAIPQRFSRVRDFNVINGEWRQSRPSRPDNQKTLGKTRKTKQRWTSIYGPKVEIRRDGDGPVRICQPGFGYIVGSVPEAGRVVAGIQELLEPEKERVQRCG